MSQVSNSSAIDIFKKVYGGTRDIRPMDSRLSQMFPFSQREKVGDSYVEAVILTHETGLTLAGEADDAFTINEAIAGAVKQSRVKASQSVLKSVIPWATISRSAGAGEKAFFEATKHIVKNNMKSHNKILEVLRLYGQSEKGLGLVGFAGTYRGVSFSSFGTGTVGGVAFTNSTNTAAKKILVAQGQFAPGIWVGMEGIVVKQVLISSGAVVGSGKLVSVDSENGILEVDFTPVAATAAGSHKLVWDGMESSKEALGVEAILRKDGSLFEINNSVYALFKGTRHDNASKKLKLENVENIVAKAVNRGGLEGDTTLLVSPLCLASIVKDEAAFRKYDASYESNAKNGFEAVQFFTPAGKVTIESHRCVKEGDAFLLKSDTWIRSGSADCSMSVPGMDQELIQQLPSQAGYQFATYADQFLLCHAPAQNVMISGIDVESST